MSEAQFEQMLLEKGIINQIPAGVDEEEEDFEPVLVWKVSLSRKPFWRSGGRWRPTSLTAAGALQISAAPLTHVLPGLFRESIRLARGEIFLRLKIPQRGVKLGEPFTKSRQNPRAKADARQPRHPVGAHTESLSSLLNPRKIHHGCKLTSPARVICL
jgi:hypothetical protein